MLTIFDNIVWHTLCGPHAQYSVGTPEARRYVAGFTPFIAFADLQRPNFDALAPFVLPDEHVYCDGWAGDAPAGWRIESEATLVRMLWKGDMPAADGEPEPVLLEASHGAAALELAALTRPGPFAARTVELGRYVGMFCGEQLVAMAGARASAGGWQEITGVCTHPDFRGKGLARRLVLGLIRRAMQDEEMPFLRVMRDNAAIHSLYQRMGFRDYRDSTAREISRR
ncbi:ribosomal protein S18 acetylase RimI-like enzyme [Janthinobacterium sp. CG_23.3]|uniref:GNAT family N-acetyltransferase n=1 Tax=Janthinobacterium sp. CG_23.3 TaxID=3349634 RepID=UPI0038D48328